MIALLYACSWIGLWVTLIGGFFVPPLWVWTVVCVASICILPVGGQCVERHKPKVVTEKEYWETVRFYKKHGGDYDAFMLKINPNLPIPGKPTHIGTH